MQNAQCVVTKRKTQNTSYYTVQEIWKKRRNFRKLQQPYQENEEELIGNILFNFESREEIEETKENIQNFWKIRDSEMKS